jgi:uncharacterized protein YecT (DUF1311 family)
MRKLERSRLESSGIDLPRIPAFDDAQAKWQAYCDAWATFDADDCSGGTIWPMMYAEAAISIVEQRIVELNAYRKRNEDG